MMPHDLTKFTIVIVFLGIILALAIFRPHILPAQLAQPTSQPTDNQESTPTPNLDEAGSVLPENRFPLEEELNQSEQDLDQREAELDRREATLNHEQAKIEEHQRWLNRRQIELDAREARVDHRQVTLDEKEAKQDEQRAALQAWNERLAQYNDRLDEEQTRLQNREASLAKWEQKLEGRIRLSIAALATSSFLAVPSLLVLVALVWQDQQEPRAKIQHVQASKTHQDARPIRHPERATATPTSVHGENGRSKRQIRHLLVEDGLI
jgi:uncharacterized protein (DUF3084 family)